MAAYESAGKSDEWYTPRYIFDAIGETFDLDVAAPVDGPRHVPTSRWYSSHALDQIWSGFIWMNPPFGNQSTKRLWLAKFFDHGNGIALLPDRTSAPWFQEAARLSDLMLFISPRVQFERPDGSIGKSPGTGTVLFASGDRACAALSRAHSLGFLATPLCQNMAKAHHHNRR